MPLRLAPSPGSPLCSLTSSQSFPSSLQLQFTSSSRRRVARTHSMTANGAVAISSSSCRCGLRNESKVLQRRFGAGSGAGSATALIPDAAAAAARRSPLSSSRSSWSAGLSLDGAAEGSRRARREWLRKVTAAVAEVKDDKKKAGGRFYFNVTGFPFPLGPFLTRTTIRTEVQKGKIWLFEQGQALGFSSVATNTRMTVIKLKSGGLWVHAPVGPTAECVKVTKVYDGGESVVQTLGTLGGEASLLLKELEAPVEFIVLPTFAYEHKIFVGPFSRAFPRAQVWVAPRQWSWPLNLPLPLLGIFRAKVLKDDDKLTPWASEIEQKIISCPEVGFGPYVEVAFFHKQSRSLLVTDAVIFVPEKPPKVVGPEALLAAAKNGLAVKLLSAGKKVPDDPVKDTAANRQKGWERMVLQILFLGPSNLLEPRQSFRRMSKKLIVSPIVKTLVYNKVPDKVRIWVQSITTDWNFKQIIPCHFAAPVPADARAFKAAFAFIEGDTVTEKETIWSSILEFLGRAGITYPKADMKTLSSLDNFLVSTGAVRKTMVGKL